MPNSSSGLLKDFARISASIIVLATGSLAFGAGFSSEAPMASARANHTVTILQNGRALVVGGTNGINDLASAELYDPGTNTWTAGGNLSTARESHTATLLPSGKVLVAGGSSGSTMLASAEIYDPATNTWSTAGSLGNARNFHTATLLANGKVLVAGGGNGGYLAASELYDPVPTRGVLRQASPRRATITRRHCCRMAGSSLPEDKALTAPR